jgi:hypothetical protein
MSTCIMSAVNNGVQQSKQAPGVALQLLHLTCTLHLVLKGTTVCSSTVPSDLPLTIAALHSSSATGFEAAAKSSYMQHHTLPHNCRGCGFVPSARRWNIADR